MHQIYQGTKFINAKPMTRQEYNDFRGWGLPENEKGMGDDEGYLVEYLDGGKPNTTSYAGYVSWSPKVVFERAYSVLPGCDRNTDGWLMRILGEKSELSDRIEKLTLFLNSANFKKLSEPMRIEMTNQLVAMQEYSDTLTRRLEIIRASND